MDNKNRIIKYLKRAKRDLTINEIANSLCVLYDDVECILEELAKIPDGKICFYRKYYHIDSPRSEKCL